jgi:hypothetical protein
MRKGIAILFVASLAGCDLEAEAESDRVCVTQSFGTNERVPGATGLSGTVTVPAAFQLDLGGALPDLDDEGVSADVNAQSIAVTQVATSRRPAGEPAADLSGITHAEATLTAPGRPNVLFSYDNAAGSPASAVVLTPAQPVDLADYVQGDRITLSNLTVSGRPPPSAWTPALETCASSRITVDYVKASGR